MGSATGTQSLCMPLFVYFFTCAPSLLFYSRRYCSVSFAHSYSPQLKLQWQTQRDVLETMYLGPAVVHHNTIYCISHYSNTVYQYQPDEDEWQKHSHSPQSQTGLAIIEDLLTAIGGKECSGETNKLLSWRDS